MNIYSAVDTVQGMYFWFCYQKACEAGDFMKFDVIRDDSISSDENFNMSSVSQQERFFMDKQINNQEQDQELDILFTILKETEEEDERKVTHE